MNLSVLTSKESTMLSLMQLALANKAANNSECICDNTEYRPIVTRSYDHDILGVTVFSFIKLKEINALLFFKKYEYHN